MLGTSHSPTRARPHRAHTDDHRYQWDKAMFLDFGDGQRLYARTTALDKLTQLFYERSSEKAYREHKATFDVRSMTNVRVRH